MRNYLLHFVQTTQEGLEQSLFWRCDADTYQHAIEQLKNEIETIQGNKILFIEIMRVLKN